MELILVDFFWLQKKLIVKSLCSINDYAEVQKQDEDFLMPKLSLDNNELIIRLILNSNGAVVSKSSLTSAWPVLIAIADPHSSDNYLTLCALFVGNGTTDLMKFFVIWRKNSCKP